MTEARTPDRHHLAFLMNNFDGAETGPGVWVSEFRGHRIVAHERADAVVVTLNGVPVYTYQGGMDAREATARVEDTIMAVDKAKTPDSHADHWYPHGRDAYADEYRRWFPKYRRVTPPIPPAGLPDIGDLVEYQDSGESPEHEGPAVILTVYKWAYGFAWDLHTRGGVLRAVRNTGCMTLLRASRMDEDSAWWVREHVWTPAMRKGYQGPDDVAHACACQYGPTGHCKYGRHEQCQHRLGLLAPSPETWITRADNTVVGDNDSRVWLADRECRWRCPCGCHAEQPAEPSRWAVMPKPKTDVEGQLDMFALI